MQGGKFNARFRLFVAMVFVLGLLEGSGDCMDSATIIPISGGHGVIYFTDAHSGKTILRVDGDDAQPFQEDLALVRRGRTFSAITPSGKVIFSTQADAIDSFSDGLAVVERGDKCGCIDKRGKVVIPFHFSWIQPFRNGLAAAAPLTNVSNRCGYINLAGKWTIEPRFAKAAPFSEEHAIASLVVDGEEKIGMINSNGTWTVRPAYDAPAGVDTLPFLHEGMVQVTKQGVVGFLGKSGAISIAPQFVDAKAFVDGLAPACIENSSGLERFTWGVIDSRGAFVIPATYTSMRPLVNGLIPAAQRGRWGVIDRRGIIVAPFIYRDMHIYNESVIWALAEDMKQGFISEKGEFVACADVPTIASSTHYSMWGNYRIGMTHANIRTEFGVADTIENTTFSKIPRVGTSRHLDRYLPRARWSEVVQVWMYNSKQDNQANHIFWFVVDSTGTWRVFANVSWPPGVQL